MASVCSAHNETNVSLSLLTTVCICAALLARPGAAGLTFSSGLLAALLDLPAADSSQSDEQHQQTHSQADSNPQGHGRERTVLT